MIRKILIAILVLSLIGAGVGYYEWHRKSKEAEDFKGIPITAVELAKEFSANESAANAKYLNKWLEVSGTVSEVDKNQEGGTMLVLDSGDPMTGVQCSMREKDAGANKGQTVKLKGMCSGSGIMGVSLTRCIIIK